MKDVNKILLIGRLGADPVEKQTRNGSSMAIFSLATSRRVRSPDSTPGSRRESEVDGEVDGEAPLTASEPEIASAAIEAWIDETQWHRVVVWGREAQHCLQYLRKGASVFVEGALRSRRFVGKDGVERNWFEVHAESVNFLGGRPSTQALPA